MTESIDPLASQALDTLQSAMHSDEVSATQVRAAQIILQRSTPKTDDEKQNEAEERECALAEARGLLAAFADIKHTNFHLARELAEARQTGTTNPKG